MVFRYLVPLICLLACGLVVDAFLWRRAVNRELLRRGLRRVHSDAMMLVDPAPGWRLIETCSCTREGQRVRVIVLARWFSRRFEVQELPEP